MKRYISIPLAIALLPTTVLAALQIDVGDTIAGLGTDISVHGLLGDKATLVIAPPFGSEMVTTLTAEDGSASVFIPGNELTQAGAYGVSLEQDGAPLGTSAKFNVSADSVDMENSALQSDSTYIQADGRDSASVSVILRDRYSNPLAGRPVELISSRSSDRVTKVTMETDENGEQLFSVTASQAGEIALRAIDLLSGRALNAEQTIAAGSLTQSMGGTYTASASNMQLYGSADRSGAGNNDSAASRFFNAMDGRALYGQVAGFDIVDSFVITAPTQMRANAYENMTITAVDQNGRVVEDYTGTVNLASTDPQAVLPSFGEITFRGADLGKKTLVLGLRFATPGEQILYVEDSTDPNVHGQVTVYVTSDASSNAMHSIVITSHKSGDTIAGETVTLEGTAPAYLNLLVTGGSQDVVGESDVAGKFSVIVPLNPGQTDHTLRIRDQSGQHDSGNLVLTLDDTAPEVQKFTFTPPSPAESEDVIALAVIKGENISTVTMQIGDDVYGMEPVKSASGTYQALFSIPSLGSFQPVLTAVDTAGNKTEVRGTIEVRAKGLPKVENVEADPLPSAVMLRWDATTSKQPVTGYRIYVGDAPGNFSYTLNTDKATTAATVAGLTPGKTYYLAVTAISGDLESIEKSDVVSTTVTGLSLTVTPGNSALSLSWTKAGAMPLQSYKLEYGVEPNVFLEQRFINGELTTYTLRDLLNGVTYYLKLTPITTTGNIMDDMAASGEGAPNSALSGFQPGPSDPIPDDFHGSADELPPLATHGGAPRQPTTGIPSWMLWTLVAGGAIATFMVMKRRRSLRTTESFFAAMDAHYNGSNFPR